jgi:CheY-like chemotaxis protein
VPAATRPIATPTRPVILLVEDDEPVRELIGRALRANGFDVVAAASGAEALDLEHHRHVDVLLSDVMLTDQNGFEVANQIHARSPRIPIIFMSGYYDRAVAEAAHLDIRSIVLQKPFAIADLLEHLRAAYAARRL